VKRFILFMWVPVLLLIQASPACAIGERGLLLDRASVDPQVMSRLDEEIAKARLETPGAFEQLADVVSGLPDRPPSINRGGLDPIARYLTPIGPDGLFPMLEMLVVRAPAAEELDPNLRKKLQIGLIDAVGALRDPRAAPILRQIVLADEIEIGARTIAALSITRLPVDYAITTLISILDNDDASLEARRAVYSVIGRCRRSFVADRLARDIYEKPDPETAALIVGALGDVGSKGAWWSIAFKEEERASEEEDTTRVATEAILWAFVHYQGQDIREKAARGLALTQHDSTQARIQEQRAGADEELSAALDQLENGYVRSVERSKRNSRGDRKD